MLASVLQAEDINLQYRRNSTLRIASVIDGDFAEACVERLPARVRMVV